MLLTVRGAAERLGVGYTTLKRWIYAGAVRTSRTAGGHHRLAEAEVERLLAQAGPAAGRRASPAPAPVQPGVIVALSGRNQLRATVDEVRVEGLLAQVRLRIGDQRLTAVITRDAVQELRLKRGDPALAIVKSTEVMVAREAIPLSPTAARRRGPGSRRRTRSPRSGR